MNRKWIIVLAIVLLTVATVLVVNNNNKEPKDIVNNETERQQGTQQSMLSLYTYRSDSNAESIEVDRVIEIEETKTLNEKIEFIKTDLENDEFIGIKINIKEIKDDNGKKILVIDLVDGERTVFSYLDAGSAGGKIKKDILTNTFLQNQLVLEDWIDGIKILLNGEEDVEGNHFNLTGIFYKQQADKVLATVNDYGYTKEPENYVDKYVYTENGQKFVITPQPGFEIIVNSLEYVNGEFYPKDELYRTTKSLLLVIELPEGLPSAQVKVTNGDISSTWIPAYNGKDGTVVLPEGFKYIDKN